MGLAKALTHFDALHIGLTATPTAYIERNTFEFYKCTGEQPDFCYPIQDAFKNKYLVPHRFATGITEIIAEGADVDDVTMTQQGLSGSGRMGHQPQNDGV